MLRIICISLVMAMVGTCGGLIWFLVILFTPSPPGPIPDEGSLVVPFIAAMFMAFGGAVGWVAGLILGGLHYLARGNQNPIRKSYDMGIFANAIGYESAYPAASHVRSNAPQRKKEALFDLQGDF